MSATADLAIAVPEHRRHGQSVADRPASRTQGLPSGSRRVVCVVPIGRLEEAKSRLAPVLAHAGRRVLAAAMAADVLSTLRECEFLERVVVLTSDASIRRLAEGFGCEIVADTGGDLNAQLDALAAALRAQCVDTLLVLPADVPCLCRDDVVDLLGRLRRGVTVCHSTADAGTNALVCSPPGAIPFLYGRESSRRHVNAAQRQGCEVVSVALSRLRDVDRPEDLDWLAHVGSHTQAARALAQVRRGDLVAEPESARVA